MKKQLVILGIITLLVAVGFSGCTENVTNGGSKVQLVDQWVDVSDSGFESLYKGKIKNVAEEQIDVKVIAKFYDKNNIYLFSATDTINNIPSTYTEEFSIRLIEWDTYYKDIDHVEYEFQVS